MRCVKTFCWFLSETNILAVLVSKSRVEINIIELMRCVKLTFCWFLSETNILAVTR